jgi:voltage-gated potassium channel
MAAAALFLVALTLVGIAGYKVLAPESTWVEAYYMTAITLTTVGFGEVIELSPAARIFTTFLLLVGMGGVLYFVSSATAFVLEGQLGHVFWRRRMQKAISDLSGHVIVCGSGSTAVYTASELLAVQREVVVVADNPDRVPAIRKELNGVPIIAGDPTTDEVLNAAGVVRAAGIVACTENDKENLVVTLSARQLNPRLRIVSRVGDIETEEKVRKVGANAVVSPDFIGALRLASELIRPTVVTFLDTMLRDRDSNLRIDEVTVPADSSAVGKTLGDIQLDELSDALLLAVRQTGDQWTYNPKRSLELTPGMVLVLLGSPEAVAVVCDAVEGTMIVAPVPASAG